MRDPSFLAFSNGTECFAMCQKGHSQGLAHHDSLTVVNGTNVGVKQGIRETEACLILRYTPVGLGAGLSPRMPKKHSARASLTCTGAGSVGLCKRGRDPLWTAAEETEGLASENTTDILDLLSQSMTAGREGSKGCYGKFPAGWGGIVP